MQQTLLLLTAVGAADAHGQMTLPPSRNGGSVRTGSQLQPAHFYVTNVQIAESTLPSDLFTAGDRSFTDEYMKKPWHSPGSAPIVSPCGIGCVFPNGDPWDHISSPECTDPSTNQDGRDLLKLPRTMWQQGGTAEVAWSIAANHGGGYAYRLCPASNEYPDESCFQQPEHHLEFAEDFHTIIWTGRGAEERIPAKRTKTGTYPAGSHWTMNPIPTDEGPGIQWPSPCSLHPCEGSPGLWPDLYMSFSIKDRVKVPANLAPGDYTLSWRWDTELTPQVWTNCADITIVAAANATLLV